MQQSTGLDFPHTPLKGQGSATTLRLRALVEKQQRIEIGERIRELRTASPETNRSISDYVGVGERSVANWIAGDTGITYDNAKKVAELFNVDVRWLWDGRERQETPDVFGGAEHAALLQKIEAEVSEIRTIVQDQLEQIQGELDKLVAQQEAGEPDVDEDELSAAERAAAELDDERARSERPLGETQERKAS